MSVPVDLTALRGRLDEYGPHPFLVTVNDDGTPHVTSVTVGMGANALTAGAGRRTRQNLATRPEVALLWPTGADPAYSLIVDAVAAVVEDEETVRLTPRAAILHRVAGADGDGPNCVVLDWDPPS